MTMNPSQMFPELRLTDLEHEIKELKIRVTNIEKRKEEGGANLIKNTPVPRGYINYRNFSKKYHFISDTCLRDIVLDNLVFFRDHVSINGNKVLFNPLAVIEFMETGNCQSSRIIKQYTQAKSYHPEIKKLIEKMNRSKVNG